MTKAPVQISFEAPVQTLQERKIARLPGEASAALPSRGQVAVVGQLNGLDVQTVLEPDGHRGHWLSIDTTTPPLPAEAGDTVIAELRTADQWPEPSIPTDLAAALEEAPDIADTWSDITPMARWEWVRWVQATKNPQTRERRVAVTISKLRGGKRRPCCFDLTSCTDPELAKGGKLAVG